ncbi:MAG TPA: hypothetical protein VGR19_05915, partial [Allosphingosinicella sp.]|nr:hypothetical protein [Allosphingosinicella sp.]
PYYREILNPIADALHLQPYELLMHPEDAMAIRNMIHSHRRLTVSDGLVAALEDGADQAGTAAAGGR